MWNVNCLNFILWSSLLLLVRIWMYVSWQKWKLVANTLFSAAIYVHNVLKNFLYVIQQQGKTLYNSYDYTGMFTLKHYFHIHTTVLRYYDCTAMFTLKYYFHKHTTSLRCICEHSMANVLWQHPNVVIN